MMGAVGDPETAHTQYRRSDPIHDLDPPQSTTPPAPNSRRCFCFPCFPSSSSSTARLWGRFRSPSQSSQPDYISTRRAWWNKGLHALMKIREWSEIVAGPKWKTFIRRFNRNRGGGGNNGGCFGNFVKGNNHNNRTGGQFQYDPLSYALNFDEGQREEDGDYYDFDDGGHGNFSSRYDSVNANRDVTVTA